MPQQNPASGSTTPIDSPFDFAHTPITGNLTLYAVWDFVYVEGGTVEGRIDYNSDYTGAFPVGRTVTLSSFYMSDHEVTQGEYETYCKYGGTYNPSYNSGQYGDGDNYPAYYVSWYDAIVYCNLRSMAEGLTPCYSLSGETDPTQWGEGINESNGKYSCSYNTTNDETWDSITCDITANGYRLPTEAEWEYAARGGQKTYGTSAFSNRFAKPAESNYIFDYDEDLTPVGWYLSNSGNTSHEVKKKTSNALGLYDMSGNIAEWCWDWYNASVGTGSVTNPCDASPGSNKRLARGGDYYGNVYACIVSNRDNYNNPYVRSSSYGFRLVRTAQ